MYSLSHEVRPGIVRVRITMTYLSQKSGFDSNKIGILLGRIEFSLKLDFVW